MKLKKLFTLIHFVTIISLIVLGVLIFSMLQNQFERERSEKKRYESFVIADELQHNTNNLAYYCRIYILTGDSLWEKKYGEVLDICSGQKPRPDGRTIALQDSMKKLGFTKTEFNKLKEIEHYSENLICTEEAAFNAMQGLFDNGKGEFTIKSTPDTALAHRIMFNQKFHTDKAKVTNSINDFLVLLDQRTNRTTETHDSISYWLLGIAVTLIVLIISISTISFFAIKNKIMVQMEELKKAKNKLEISEAKLTIQNEELDKKVEKRTKELENQNKEYAELNENYKIVNEELEASDEELRQNVEELLASNERAEMQYKQIKKSEAKQRKILDSFNDGIYINSPDYKIVYANLALQTKIGHNPVGESCHKALYNLDKKCSWCIYEKLKEEKTIEYEVENKNGKILDVTNILLENDDKLTTFHDITEKVKTEQKIRQLSTVVEQSPSAIVITNTKGNIEYVNPIFTKTTGYTFDEAVGKNPRILKSPKTKSETYTDLWATIARGKIWYGEFLNVKKNGEEYWEQAVISSIKNNKGKIINYLAIKNDISNLKKIEQELKESEKNYKHLIKNARTAIIKLNKTGFIIFFNEYATELFGYTEKEVIGKHVISTIVPGFDSKNRDLTKMVEMFTSSVGKHYETVNENENITKSGKRIWMSWSNKAIVDSNNDIVEIVSVGINISDRKKAELALKEAKQEADTANRLKSEFLANMSHEIRTPMNAVLGFSEILSNKLSEMPEYKPLVDGIVSGGKNLITLINDILDLSKIEAGRLEIKPAPVNLSSLMRDIKQIFSVKIESKNLLFPLEIDKRLPQSLMLDQTRIRQILFNLVGNAIKFTDTGSISISVKIEGDTQPESKIDLYFEIKDTGIGIPENQIDKIFEAFIQTKGQSTKYGGTGLGLPITKRLIEAMNGNVTVESKVGKGSVFRIHLKKVTVSSIEVLHESKDKNCTPINIQFKEPEILLVDDIKSNRDVVKYHLNAHNCKVYEAENGEEVIHFLKNNTPDLILMDIQMPVLNGYEATKQIKEHKEWNSIPVIALTALAMKEQLKKYGEMFDAYLKKPISKSELFRSLMKFLPYTETEQKESKKAETTNYAEQLATHIAKNGRLPEAFIEIYKTEILPLYEEVNDMLDIDDCKELAEKLIEAGEKFNIETVINFGTELMTATKSYQITKIEQLLSEIMMNYEW